MKIFISKKSLSNDYSCLEPLYTIHEGDNPLLENLISTIVDDDKEEVQNSYGLLELKRENIVELKLFIINKFSKFSDIYINSKYKHLIPTKEDINRLWEVEYFNGYSYSDIFDFLEDINMIINKIELISYSDNNFYENNFIMLDFL